MAWNPKKSNYTGKDGKISWCSACLYKQDGCKLPVKNPDGSYNHQGPISAYKMAGHVSGISSSQVSSIQSRIAGILSKEFNDKRYLKTTKASSGVIMVPGDLPASTGTIHITKDTIWETYNNLPDKIPLKLSHSEDEIFEKIGIKEIGYIPKENVYINKDNLIYDNVVYTNEIIKQLIENKTFDTSINATYDTLLIDVDDDEIPTPQGLRLDSVDLVGSGACKQCKITANGVKMDEDVVNIKETEIKAKMYNLQAQVDQLTQINEKILAEKEDLQNQLKDAIKKSYTNDINAITQNVRAEIKEEMNIEYYVEELVNRGVVLAKQRDTHIAKAKQLGYENYVELMKNVTPAISLKKISAHEAEGIAGASKMKTRQNEEGLEDLRINAALGRITNEEKAQLKRE